MKPVKHKAFAYITHHQSLLVFRHPFEADAGIQVPAGTIEAGETPEEAVLREAFEETGIAHLTLDCFLGEHKRDMSDFGCDEIHHRHFYHLRCNGPLKTTWRHEERAPSHNPSRRPIIFEFFWVSLPHEVPPLIADHGEMLPQLLNKLSDPSRSKKYP